MKYLHYGQPFLLESGESLNGLTIAYQTYGTLNAEKNNVVWVCHALTANAAAEEWWPGLIGSKCAIDTDRYLVVCANILGSCYGSTGPLSINQDTGHPYYHAFPFITIRDMIKAHQLLAHNLGIQKIHLLMGGSMGGYQVFEWCCMQPHFIENIFLIATAAQESAWGIAIHTAQRMAIESDGTWQNNGDKAGEKGLKTARAIGMVTYRSFETYAKTQSETDTDKTKNFRAESYIRYQGQKLANRFNAFSYYVLTKAMDSHNIARQRAADIKSVLKQLTQPALLIGISSDLLCPAAEMEKTAQQMPQATYHQIESLYGHDGFLIEVEKISTHLKKFLKGK